MKTKDLVNELMRELSNTPARYGFHKDGTSEYIGFPERSMIRRVLTRNLTMLFGTEIGAKDAL